MNLIQKQAKDFFWEQVENGSSYKTFLSELQSVLYNYRKEVHKVEFLESIIHSLKTAYDDHYQICADKEGCALNKFYENTIFFAQNELDNIYGNLPQSEFSKVEKNISNDALNTILSDLNVLKLGSQATYDDFYFEFQELKKLYYLNKKNWSQLLIGKLTEMVARGVISETVCKEIVNVVQTNYPHLLQSPFNK